MIGMKRAIIAVVVVVLFNTTIVTSMPDNSYSFFSIGKNSEINNQKLMNEGIMNSSWPMYCHDVRHTGRSPYSTVNTTSAEKWRFIGGDWNWGGSPVINDQGIIYFGNDALYAIYPNGSLKWKQHLAGSVESTPAIDNNGVIYVGISHPWVGLYAYYSNGSYKWAYHTGEIFSSPTIGNDGTIYFGTGEGGDPRHGFIYALNSNGTLRWRFRTGHVVYSSPAIDSKGTIYCGSHDGKLYAIYPNNGTAKWNFSTGGWVHGSPTIGDDGTIYIGSDSKYLYALYPNNGTMKWSLSVGSMFAAPALDKEGTLYFGVWESAFQAVYPNGTMKWIFDLGSGNGVWGSSAAISADGTVYFGTFMDKGSGGGELIALNLDGTLKWRKMIATDFIWSSPAIGKDGTVYIASTNDLYHVGSECYLHAFGPGEQKTFTITEPIPGHFYFLSKDLGETPLGKTIAFGSVHFSITIHPDAIDEVDNVQFYLEDDLIYTDTEPPYEWDMNKRYERLFHYPHIVNVIANFKGGCQWTESMQVLYIHLRFNFQ